ncbi:MAG: hypothetical protein MJ078_07335, partial [Clostridia bacterium]|nr:hypothetical protein [Clostridia bacterium]
TCSRNTVSSADAANNIQAESTRKNSKYIFFIMVGMILRLWLGYFYHKPAALKSKRFGRMAGILPHFPFAGMHCCAAYDVL